LLSRRWEPVAAICTVAVVGLVTGLTVPLVSLRLSADGASAVLIGTAAALPAVGILAAVLCLGPLTWRWRVKPLLVAGMVGSALSTGLLVVTDAVAVWLVLRFAVGAFAGVLLVLGETWINAITAEATRGRWIALYTSVFTLCQVSGPGLLALFGSAAQWSLLIAVLAHVPGVLLLAASPCEVDGFKAGTPSRIVVFARSAPTIALAVLMFSFFDSAVLALLPLYGMDYGHTETIAVLMVGAVFAGDALLQVPLGWWSDRVDRRRLHLGCGVAVLLLALGMPLLLAEPAAMWPALVVLGAAAGGVYTLGLVRIGRDFGEADLVDANAGATVLWALGSLIGPVAGSAALNLLPPDGLMLALAAVTALFLTAAVADFRVREPLSRQRPERLTRRRYSARESGIWSARRVPTQGLGRCSTASSRPRRRPTRSGREWPTPGRSSSATTPGPVVGRAAQRDASGRLDVGLAAVTALFLTAAVADFRVREPLTR
jgi:MFS family permease